MLLRLRPATADDLVLSYTITEDAMRLYVEQTWGRWNAEEQLERHAQGFSPESHRIIVSDERDVGLVAVESDPTCVWLVKLYLLASHRGQGIGSQVLQDVVQGAHMQSKPVRLRVLRVNTRAKELYERHGFRVIDQTPERFFMEHGA